VSLESQKGTTDHRRRYAAARGSARTGSGASIQRAPRDHPSVGGQPNAIVPYAPAARHDD
jgi:hypothetical protein